MPTPALLLLLATLLPLALFALMAFLGKRLGDPLAGWIATAGAIGSFSLSMAAMIAWLNSGQLDGVTWGPGDKPIDLTFKWLPFFAAPAADHPSFLNLNLYIDTLTIAMFNTITPVIALAHVYAVRYLRDDKRFERFFLYLQLLTFAMLGLVLGGSLLQILLFWYLLALAAFPLLNFWSPFPQPIASFIANRIGDIAFLIGIGIFLLRIGNPTFLQLDRWLPNDAMISNRALTVAGLAIFCGIAGKSAQFPLHFWLPASSRAPVPAAAVIQSITLTAAGVYLLSRFFPILTPTVKTTAVVVGLLSLLIGAALALFQRDVIKLLACSTISQFGLIFMALGTGTWIGGLFHLLSHAFFKSLLLLAAGSVIHAAHGEQRLIEFGGMLRKMPVTAVAFAIGLLAISAAPFTGGYYSSETILLHFATLALNFPQQKFYWVCFYLPAVVSALTALYMTRCWMLIFWGKPRNQNLFDNSRERSGLWFPLIALSVLSLIAGSRLLEIDQFIAQSAAETTNYCNALREPNAPEFTSFAPPAPTSDDIQAASEQLFRRYAVWPFGVGIFVGLIFYRRVRVYPPAIAPMM